MSNIPSTPPSKRLKTSSLLQYGFTGNKPETDFVQCPLCDKLWPTSQIVIHSAQCRPIPSNQATGDGNNDLRSAFDVMRTSSLAADKKPTPHVIYFALVQTNEGQILPVLYHDASRTKELFKHNPQQYNLWECDSNVRKLRVKFRVSGASATRDSVLHLVTNIPSTSADSVDQFILPHAAHRPASSVPGSPPVSVALLKSMLQKAVRRKQTLKAVRLAAMLCDPVSPAQASAARGPTGSPSKLAPPKGSSPNSPLSELLRRLPIICLEDGALHPAFPIVVWMMIAVSKGYRPPTQLIHIVLLFVADIAGSTYRDCMPPDTVDFASLPSVSTAAAKSIGPGDLADIHSDAVRTLVASISLRASFGGMTSDMHMLDRYAQLWYERLADGAQCVMHGTAAGSTGGQSGGGSEGSGSKVSELPASQTVEKAQTALDSEYLSQTYLGGLREASPAWTNLMLSNLPSSASAEKVMVRSDLGPAVAQQLFVRCQALTAESSSWGGDGGSGVRSGGAGGKINDGKNSSGERSGYADAALTALLRLTGKDLVAEGIDQHVDFALVPHLVSVCKERLLALDAAIPTISGSSGASVSSPGPSSSSGVTTTTTTTTARISDGINDSSPVRVATDLPDHLLQDIQAAIWLFRSSSNSRKLWPFPTPSGPEQCSLCTEIVDFHTHLCERDLAGKRRRAKIWSIICPVLVAYCERKVASLAKRL